MISLELKWMGYFLVREAILEPDQVRSVAAELDDDIEFVDFAQAVVDKGLTSDFELIQKLVDESFEAGQAGGEPPVNIFKNPAPPRQPESLPVAQPEPLPVAQPEPEQGAQEENVEDEAAPVAERPPLRLRMASSDSVKEKEPVETATPSATSARPRPKPIPLKLKRDQNNTPPESPTAELKGVRSQLKALEAEAAGSRAEAAKPSPVKPSPPEPSPAKPSPAMASPAMASPAMASPVRASVADISLAKSSAISQAMTEAAAAAAAGGQEVPAVNSAIGKSPIEAARILAQLLIDARDQGASDLHLSANAPLFVRVNLENQYLEEEPLDPRASEALNLAPLTDEQRQEFDKEFDLDYLLALDEHNRFRVNLMRHREGIAGSYRLVPDRVYSLTELGFQNPEIITKLLDHHNGIILVTGPVGCGKTTTLAALVEILNSRRSDHVICVEDPIEIVQKSQKCIVTQREVGRHTKSFATALKGALREDPDIIVIGEMRDLQTIEMAITAAETGHLVIGTLHTSDAATTLNRILDVFPPAQQAQIRSMTAESLRGVICQKLIPTVEGGIALAEELLIGTIAVSNIIRDGKMHQLKAILQTGSRVGMCTMDQSIFRLYENGQITVEVALANINDSELVRRIHVMEREAAEAAAAAGKRKKGWFR